jgi:hypothetical protein
VDAQREVDESLVQRVSLLSRGEQRWLKLAIKAIQTNDGGPWSEAAESDKPATREPRRLKAANLEDVITGKADLRDQLEAYPELAGELEGLADVIDLLREAGERRRRKGEDILRDLLEGEGRDESGGNGPRERPRK